MSNSISFTGRLGKDAELKDVGDYQKLEFTVANNTGFGDKQKTSWFKCGLWGARGAKIKEYLTKGKEVFVCGEMSVNDYEKKDGTNGYSLEIRVNSVDFIGGREEPKIESKPAEPAKVEVEEEDLPF